MKNFFNKYKEAMPFIIAASVVGSVVMNCALLVVVGKKED